MPGGNVYNTVIDGAISTRPMGSASVTTYEDGGTFVAPAGEYVDVGNSGDVSARMTPRRSCQNTRPSSPTLTSTVCRHPPTPSVVGQAVIDVDRPSGVFELMQMLVEFEPGMWTATHMHGGYDLSMVAMGAVTLERRGEVKSFTLGQAFLNTPGLFHKVRNESEGSAQLAVTFLVPTGATLTTLQPVDTPLLTAPGLAD